MKQLLQLHVQIDPTQFERLVEMIEAIGDRLSDIEDTIGEIRATTNDVEDRLDRRHQDDLVARILQPRRT
jgi:hypothetical protein